MQFLSLIFGIHCPPSGLGYVAASRVRSIENFYLLEPITRETLRLKWCGQLKFVNSLMEWARLCRISVPMPFPPPDPYPPPPSVPAAHAPSARPPAPPAKPSKTKSTQTPKPPATPAVAPPIAVPLVPFPPPAHTLAVAMPVFDLWPSMPTFRSRLCGSQSCPIH